MAATTARIQRSRSCSRRRVTNPIRSILTPVRSSNIKDFLKGTGCCLSASLAKTSVKQYEREGILFPVRVLADGDVARYRDALESVAASCRGEGNRRRFDNLHLFFPWAYQLAATEPLLDAVGSFIGSELVVDGTLVFSKPPRDTSYASWHQNSVYSGWHLTPSISAWTALTPGEGSNGSMRVIPG